MMYSGLIPLLTTLLSAVFGTIIAMFVAGLLGYFMAIGPINWTPPLPELDRVLPVAPAPAAPAEPTV